MSKAKNYLGGVGASIFMGGGMIFIGFLLSITVIGAIIGVPLIIIGFAQIVLSPFTGVFFVFKKCPYCQANILVIRNQQSLKCQKCKNRLILRDKKLEVVNVGAPAPVKHVASSDADEIKKLAKLKEEGVLTQDEFEKKKAKILES